MNDPGHIFRKLMSLQGPALAGTVLLLVLGYVVLAPGERRLLRGAVYLLLGHVSIGVLVLTVLPDPHPRWLLLAMAALLFAALARVTFLLIVDWLIGKRLKYPLPKILRDILQALVFVTATFIGLKVLGYQLSSLLATSAVLTAVIGLSLQETLGNVFAGLAVQAERPFQVGDWVQFGEGQVLVGRVKEINWRATKLWTAAQNEIVVPNGIIAKASIQNFGRPEPVMRMTVSFLAPYESSPQAVADAVHGALLQIPGVLETPAPALLTENFAETGIRYQLAYSIVDFGARRSIESQVRNRIWYGLERAGIAMPCAPVRPASDDPRGRSSLASMFGAERCAAHLASVEFFGSLPDGVRERLAGAALPERYGEGEPIVVQGDAGGDLFAVAQGSAKVVSALAPGEEVEVATLGPGSIFGEMSMVTGSRGATVKAATEVVVWRITHESFRRFVEEVPGLAAEILGQLNERHQQLNRPEEQAGTSASVDVRRAFFSRVRRLFAVE